MATTNGNLHSQDYTPSNEASEQIQSSSSNHDLTKDEVGWYFVEQYYTTLSKNPDKLHVRLCPILFLIGFPNDEDPSETNDIDV